MTNAEKYKDCLEYIDKYWDKIIFKPSSIYLEYKYIKLPNFLPLNNRNPHIINIPNSYIVPNTAHFKRIYYWDSFFMFRGLMGTKRQHILKKMVNNFIYLFEKYQIIPNFNAPASTNRSQPPFLTSMILDSYFAPLNNQKNYRYYSEIRNKVYKIGNIGWLKKAIGIAKKEYEIVWIDLDNLYNHHVKGFILSRYGDRDIGYAHSSELESGWDMTSRFYNRADQFLPIDLNSYLYKYETDFAAVSKMLGDTKGYEDWTIKAKLRKKEINELMWDENEKFFFDYGYVFKQKSLFYSLASYTPMWAGIASPIQAKQMVAKLSKFETPYGLTISARESLAKPIDLSKIQRRFHPSIEDIIKPKQWDFPNIWSPLEYLSVIGLLKYGFITDAKRIMEKSIKAHAKLFREHDTFFEKINGETGTAGTGALYGDQKGFGWTNAIFYRYIQILDSINSLDSIYADNLPKTPPYTLAIPH